MSSVNNLLFSISNMAPAMLNVGGGRAQNYDSLAAINNSLFGSNTSTNSLLNGSSSSSSSDRVSLTYQNISKKMVSELAAVTASTIKEYPDLDKDYVIAIVDNGTTREARVYRRSEILENFDGTDKEKEALQKQLDADPLMVFTNGNGLPDTSEDKSCQALADNINTFLKDNVKTFNTLSNAGYDTFADMMADSKMKKTLVSYVGADAAEESKDSKTLSKKLLEQLKEAVSNAVKKNESLKDDYVVAIVDDGVSREVKVYSREEILKNFEGTEEEKKKLKADLDKNPVMVFSNGNGLPESASDEASKNLAAAIQDFLDDNEKDLDKVAKDGYDPLADLLGLSSMKKNLVNYAGTVLVEDDEE